MKHICLANLKVKSRKHAISKRTLLNVSSVFGDSQFALADIFSALPWSRSVDIIIHVWSSLSVEDKNHFLLCIAGVLSEQMQMNNVGRSYPGLPALLTAKVAFIKGRISKPCYMVFRKHVHEDFDHRYNFAIKGPFDFDWDKSLDTLLSYADAVFYLSGEGDEDLRTFMHKIQYLDGLQITPQQLSAFFTLSNVFRYA